MCQSILIIRKREKPKPLDLFSFFFEKPNLASSTTMGDEQVPFCLTPEADQTTFPCNANPIHAASLGIAAGGLGLLMTIFLTKKVSFSYNFRHFLKDFESFNPFLLSHTLL